MDNTHNRYAAQTAAQDFERARRKAFLNDILATLRRQPNWLLSFDEVQRALSIESQHYRGLQTVPVNQIVGSVDRYHDFDRRFLPTQRNTRPRWESVDIATLTDVTLPPVQLYKVGGAYFVKDGNHRVSVAKEKGATDIDAEVIECVTTVPLSPNTDPRELLHLAERARFLKCTQLDKQRDVSKIGFTTLGRYDVLLEHISAHRWFMGIEQDRPIEWEEAVLDWFDNIYLPMIEEIEEKQILADFPRHTPGDLYLWIMDFRWYLRESSGEDIGPESATLSYSEKHAAWTRKVLRGLRRLQEAASQPLALRRRRVEDAKSKGPETRD
jgi:hypothetical protein